ncbi:MAG TPA: hypothetical protein VMS00_14325 [Acidimicrobiales bacterium]|nr:hypothetical protein [Acidimicrobiales bacterium]
MRAPWPGFNIFGGWNATIPFARLSFFSEGLRLGSSIRFLPFRALMPVWEARYDELTEVSAIGPIPLMNWGVRFRVASDEWIVFWTLRRSKVLQEVAARGVTVNTKPVRFRYFHPGR